MRIKLGMTWYTHFKAFHYMLIVQGFYNQICQVLHVHQHCDIQFMEIIIKREYF